MLDYEWIRAWGAEEPPMGQTIYFVEFQEPLRMVVQRQWFTESEQEAYQAKLADLRYEGRLRASGRFRNGVELAA